MRQHKLQLCLECGGITIDLGNTLQKKEIWNYSMQRVPTLVPSFINGKTDPAQHNSSGHLGHFACFFSTASWEVFLSPHQFCSSSLLHSSMLNEVWAVRNTMVQSSHSTAGISHPVPVTQHSVLWFFLRCTRTEGGLKSMLKFQECMFKLFPVPPAFLHPL